MTRKTKANVNRSKRTRKTGSQVKALESRLNNLVIQAKKPKQKRKTPFADVGSTVGRSIGGMFGNGAVGSGIGRWLGTGIGSIFGSGDYQMQGSAPKYNVLANGSQIPQFSTGRQTNVVCHREYLGDISGTTNFSITAYPLNPGLAQTFPWLSTVAQNYQEYKFHGVIFEFRSLITDFVTAGAPGVIVMSTNYNADSPTYLTKQQMENAEYAVSVKPTCNLIHGIECAVGQTILQEKYVRTGAVPTNQDLRLYDMGNFQLATQSNPNGQDLGELWVSYCVEFFKPIQPQDFGGEVLSGHLARTGVSTLNPYGTVSFVNAGSLPLTIATGNVVGWAGQPTQKYLVTLCWTGTSSVAVTLPAFTPSGGIFLQYFNGDTNSSFTCPLPTTVNNTLTLTVIFQCNTGVPTQCSISAGGAGVFPGTTALDVFVTEIDNAITS